jgi:hypothetical protein
MTILILVGFLQGGYTVEDHTPRLAMRGFDSIAECERSIDALSIRDFFNNIDLNPDNTYTVLGTCRDITDTWPRRHVTRIIGEL